MTSSLDRIGLVVSGALGLPATYTGPLDEDARILLALDHPALELPPPEPTRTVTVISAVLQAGFVTDWAAALAAYERAPVARAAAPEPMREPPRRSPLVLQGGFVQDWRAALAGYAEQRDGALDGVEVELDDARARRGIRSRSG